MKANQCFINLEIKPIPGTEAHTGTLVAQQALELWKKAAAPPLLSSFSEAAIAAARDAAPELPRALLITQVPEDWRMKLKALDCTALAANWKTLPDEMIAQTQALGYQVLTYTVNDEDEAQRLLHLGVASIITDEVHNITPQ